MECTRLWNAYTNSRLKYRIAVADAARSSTADNLDKLRDASEHARRTLEDHERAHDPKRQVAETRAPAPAAVAVAVGQRARGVILLPPVS